MVDDEALDNEVLKYTGPFQSTAQEVRKARESGDIQKTMELFDLLVTARKLGHIDSDEAIMLALQGGHLSPTEKKSTNSK